MTAKHLPPTEQWLRAHKSRAFRRRGRERAAARHRAAIRSLRGKPGAVRLRASFVMTDRHGLCGTVTRMHGWLVAEVRWVSPDGTPQAGTELWKIDDLEAVPICDRPPTAIH